MKLSELLLSCTSLKVRHLASDFELMSLAYDSRKVREKSLFIACQGLNTDGHVHIEQAIFNGAQAIVCEKFPEEKIKQYPQINWIMSDDTRRSLSELAHLYYQRSSEKMKVIGVTGTNGKTTTACLIESILNQANLAPAFLGTIYYQVGGEIFNASHTTPESLDLQSLFHLAYQRKNKSMVMEVSSHALALKRCEDIAFDVAVFTNLTKEHLDFHESMDAYFEAKLRLFTELLEKSPKKIKRAVINLDQTVSTKILDRIKSPYLTYSTYQSDADIYAKEFSFNLEGIKAQIQTPEGEAQIKSPLIGKHNLENILAAFAAGLALQIPLNDLVYSLSHFKAVPGRLERIENPKGAYIFVDYAHTPDAIAKVLIALKGLKDQSFSEAKLRIVFGCGGNRDTQKRPLMALEASNYADYAIVTSDNPRMENPQKIVEDILPGFEKNEWKLKQNYEVELNRKNAIERACKLSEEGDILLVAGKGHEDYQIIGDKKIHFDDREVVREFFK